MVQLIQNLEWVSGRLQIQVLIKNKPSLNSFLLFLLSSSQAGEDDADGGDWTG